MPPTTTVRSHPCNSSTPPSMSSARSSARNTGFELSLPLLHDRLNQLDSGVCELKSTVLTKNGYVDLRNQEDKHIRREFDTLRATSDRIELNVGRLHSDVNQIKSRLDSVDSRLDSMASHMGLSDRVRFNSLAHTISAPISSVPVITDNGALEWPKYFPPTVWKFWCLKKRSRVHRLVQLAEFYELGGYRDWSRMHQTDMSAEGDSSDSSDGSFTISREEAVRRFPEAAHQALAATLGLVYYKIRNEVGEGPNAVPSRPLKRPQGNLASASPGSKPRVKIPRRPSVSDTYLQRLINGPSVTESPSSVSEEYDKLGWNAFSDVSEDAMSKLRSIDPQDIGTVLRALEQGRLKLKPSGSEEARLSPKAGSTQLDESLVPTEPKTPTQQFSSRSRKAKLDPETSSSSNSDSATS
ncbi:hypothetical protein N7448_011432 [Penicillium atrosanguineum]|nr:hypothetical protein N7448_011432 [Penicillium atrosanguineum]